jgi:hypothetical protein
VEFSLLEHLMGNAGRIVRNMKIEKKIVVLSLYTAVMLHLVVSPSYPLNAELTNIIVRNVNGNLVIDIMLKGIFTKEVETAIQKGIPVDLVFSVSLHKVRDFWFDKKLIGINANHRVRLDVLKKVYEINRSWEQSGPRYEKDPQKVQRIISEIMGLHVIPCKQLRKGEQYQLRVKSELSDRGYPLAEAPWEFKTDWYSINFIY